MFKAGSHLDSAIARVFENPLWNPVISSSWQPYCGSVNIPEHRDASGLVTQEIKSSSTWLDWRWDPSRFFLHCKKDTYIETFAEALNWKSYFDYHLNSDLPRLFVNQLSTFRNFYEKRDKRAKYSLYVIDCPVLINHVGKSLSILSLGWKCWNYFVLKSLNTDPWSV